MHVCVYGRVCIEVGMWGHKQGGGCEAVPAVHAGTVGGGGAQSPHVCSSGRGGVGKQGLPVLWVQEVCACMCLCVPWQAQCWQPWRGGMGWGRGLA